MEPFLVYLSVKNNYNIKFNDAQINLNYATAEVILKKKGYKAVFFPDDDDNERLRGAAAITNVDGLTMMEFHAGGLSAPSLNQYLVENFGSLFRHAALFPLGGRVAGVSDSGVLAEEFPLAAVGDRAVGFQQDMLVHERFLSFKTEDYTKFQYPSGVQAWSKGLNVTALPVAVKNRAVSYVFNKEQPFYIVVDKLDEATRQVLRREEGLFVASAGGELDAISNWEGAKYFLPPNALVLGFKLLDMIDRPVPTVYTKVESLSSYPSDLSLCLQVDPDDILPKVKTLVAPFQDSPSGHTFRSVFVNNKSLTDLLRAARLNGMITRGSRNKSNVTVVKEMFKDGDWQDLWQLVQNVSIDLISAYSLMANMHSQIFELRGLPVFRQG